MSFYDDASLVVIPSAQKTSKVYSVKPTDGTGDLTFTRASTATRVNSSGLIEAVASNVPRLDYLGSTCPRLQLEGQRTNLFLRSETFTSASWLSGGGGVSVFTDNFATSPSGAQTASKWTAANTNSQVRQNVATINTTATVSVYLRTNSGTKNVTLFINDIGSTAVVTVTTSWQRFVLTGAVGATLIGAGRCGFSNVTVLTAGDYIEVWGAQYEVGANPTSYIPTTTATVTRVVDDATKTGITSLIGQTEGTLFLDFEGGANDSTNHFLGLSDGTTGNRVVIVRSTSNTLYTQIRVGGVDQAFIQTGTLTANTRYKCAVAYKLNDIAFYVNGALVGTDTAATIPATSVFATNNGTGSSYFERAINQTLLFKTRLTNAQLAELTTL
jgi:hypothetical protein